MYTQLFNLVTCLFELVDALNDNVGFFTMKIFMKNIIIRNDMDILTQNCI